MKTFKEKIEAIFTAVTFAEADERESALSFLRSSQSNEEAYKGATRRRETNRSNDSITVGQKLASHFVAAAFAEAGDFQTAREMLPGYQRKQTVLLAIEGDNPNEATFDYTINLCRRLNANMDILQMISRGRHEEVEPSQALAALLTRLDREKISYEVTVREARADEVLYDHVRLHREVVTAVIDSPSLRSKEATETYWQDTFRRISKKLSVPLVTALQRESGKLPAGLS